MSLSGYIRNTLLLLQIGLLVSLRAERFKASDGTCLDWEVESRYRSIRFIHSKSQVVFPFFQLHNATPLSFQFDDVSENEEPYYYTVYHCTYDWKISNLLPSEYIEGLEEIPIETYITSHGTSLRYSHYSFAIPNINFSFKLSGNYLLVILNEMGEAVISRRLIVHEPKVSPTTEVITVPLGEPSHQIKTVINTAQTDATDPYQDLKVVILPDLIWQEAKSYTSPSYIAPDKWTYHSIDKHLFPAGNNYRFLTLEQIVTASGKVLALTKIAGMPAALLAKEVPRNRQTRDAREGLLGFFAIGALDIPNPNYSAEYLFVRFSFSPTEPLPSPPYLFGQFTSFQTRETYKMKWDAKNNCYAITLPLKQGLYNYKYVTLDKEGHISETHTEGNFIGTSRLYTVLIYATSPSTNYHRLIGLQTLSSARRVKR